MTTEVEKEVNPHFEDFLFEWHCKSNSLSVDMVLRNPTI